MKPLEVEILVAEVGLDHGGDQLFRILYDGTVFDEDNYTVLGGEADAITERLKTAFDATWGLGAALKAAVAALAGPDRQLPSTELEIAVLARANGRRAFRRVVDDEAGALLA
jgi:proteasome alpha subunit